MSKNKNNRQGPQTVQPPKGVNLGADMIDEMDDEDEHEGIEVDKDLVQIVCLHRGATVKFNIAGRRYRMKYGDISEVEAAYGTPRLFRAGADTLPSVIELETGRKVLPVLDPRVDKNEDGEPLVTVQAREDKRQRMQARRGQDQQPSA